MMVLEPPWNPGGTPVEPRRNPADSLNLNQGSSMRDHITQNLLRSIELTGKRQEIHDTELPGMSLRIGPQGSMSYYVTYRTEEGRKTRYCLGSTKKLTPKLARKAAQKYLASVRLGQDPAEARRRAKAHDLEAYLDNIYGPWLKENRKTGDAMFKRLKSTFRPLLSARGKSRAGRVDHIDI